ncbi:alkaline phosphatase [Flavobacterium sp. MAHUQ-51]|uniref:alkaline phosphatase n=1 Tax=Flavobacterium sp. GCM10022190 TaxID=3252639 RepID=UPI0036096A88
MKQYIKLVLILIVSLLGINNKLYAQNSIKIHSHNDYNQQVPFWDAFANGASSIEADIFLKDNHLYVAHTDKEIQTSRTLESLYLKPLENALKMGFKKEQTLFFLIDSKTEAVTTLNHLVKSLKKHPAIISNASVKIIISGNRPPATTYSSYPDFIYFDYQEIDKDIAAENLKKVAMVSLNFKNYSSWNGKGRLTHEDYKQVTAAIAQAKAFQKPIRFWASPDSNSAWKALIDLGVDIVNTDSPYDCVQYVASLAKRYVTASNFSKVYTPSFKTDQQPSTVKNIILLIGDGNGLTQISSAVLANNGVLSLTQLKSLGLLKTQSADDFTTDSAAAGTALATGIKTNNRAIGVDTLGKPKENILEFLHHKGFSTGCITTDEIVGATPAAFFAHRLDRSDAEGIATDLVNSKLDLFVGGGATYFKDKKITSTFSILPSVAAIAMAKTNPIGVFIGEKGVSSVLDGRGNVLAEATKNSLDYLNQKKKPFFLMVEGAQIDSFGHANNVAGIVAETLDFDKAITEALLFADKNDGTLVLITADHETSGFAIPQGDVKKHEIEGDFITHDHTGTMVPLFAYGPQSNKFTGVYENNELFHKILEVLQYNK